MTAMTELLIGAFAAAAVLGASAQATRFCPQGGLRETLLERKPTRLAAYGVAIGAALVAVALLQLALGQTLIPSRPAYTGPELPWGRYVLGGLLFGVGMVLARGCPLRTLVRVGQGSLQAVLVLAAMGLAAYAMSRTSLYGLWFSPWIDGWSLDLRRFGLAHQDLATVLGLGSTGAHVVLGLALGAVALVLCWRALPLRKSWGLWLGAVLIGVVVAAGYALTAGPIGQRAIEDASFMGQPPDGLGVQSYTFAGPLSDAVYFLLHPSSQTTTFGVMALAGALLGALLAALLRRDFRLQGLAGWREGVRQLFGAALTGGGAVLGLGCTVGHGLSGLSVLSIGSMLGLASIFTGAWLAIRLEAGRRAAPLAGAPGYTAATGG
uniref:Putative transporter n=1 Tax=mine drainage metagenome TaxID=410659 RepID=E6PM60_9ZZZZ